MPLRWLPEDDEYPVRPDLPVLRHLDFTEVHAIEIGIYLGLLAFFGVQIGYTGEIMTLMIGVVRFTMSDARSKKGSSKATHRLGFHDVRQEPHYFGIGFLIVYGPASLSGPLLTLLGLGSVL